ncbi:hypothetical protein AB4331_05920 [Vibrio breoganii]
MNKNASEHLQKMHTKKVLSGGNVPDANDLLSKLRVSTGLEQPVKEEAPLFPERTQQTYKEPEWVPRAMKATTETPDQERAYKEMDESPQMAKAVKAIIEIATELSSEINDTSSPMDMQMASGMMIAELDAQKDKIMKGGK